MRFGRTTVATWITLARLGASPIFILCFCLAVPGGVPTATLVADLDPWWMGVGLLILVAQEISDIVDGTLARRHGAVTDLGRLLDPLADTLSHMGAALCLMWVGLVPFWLLIVMYYREAIIGMGRTLLARNGIVLGARISGKVKSVCQAGYVIVLVAGLLLAHFVEGFPIDRVADGLAWLVAAVTLFSLGDYLVAVKKAKGAIDEGRRDG